MCLLLAKWLTPAIPIENATAAVRWCRRVVHAVGCPRTRSGMQVDWTVWIISLVPSTHDGGVRA